MTDYERNRRSLTRLISQEAPAITAFAENHADEFLNLLDALMESKALVFSEGRHYQMIRMTPPFDYTVPPMNPYKELYDA